MATSSFSHRLQKSFEPVALAMSGKRWFPLYAIVNHRGRSSGKPYKTPIAVVPTHGRQTNWARNVVAAGGVDLTWKGRTVHTTSPRIIDAVEAAALAKAPFRPVVKRMPGAIVLHEQSE